MKDKEVACNPHPDAPHGFLRSASHSADRYVCECEGWEPPRKLFLPNDCARCEGVPTSEGWRTGCAYCLRRICDPPTGPYTIYTAPPKLVDGGCPNRIESYE